MIDAASPPDADTLSEELKSIQAAHPNNLMARHVDVDTYAGLDAAGRARFWRIIRSGVVNPGSAMGIYALEPGDYVDFATLFDAVIRDHHGIPEGTGLRQSHEWTLGETDLNPADTDPALGNTSLRVRVGRNMEGYPLPGAMDLDQRRTFERMMISAFETLKSHPAFGGAYLSLTPGTPYTIDTDTYKARIGAHQMFRDMRGDPYLKSAGIAGDWPEGRGMYVSDAEDFLVWVGEEDQLRIMAMGRGIPFGSLLTRLHDGLSLLERQLPAFCHSDELGYLTSCPTNVGTAMRASAHLALPRLTQHGKSLHHLKELGNGLGLSIRGLGGEHTDAGAGGLVDVSPRARLGVTEADIMRRLHDGMAALRRREQA